MRINRGKRQIKNKVNTKPESRKYSLIPEGYERQYERWLLDKELEELCQKHTKFKESLGIIKQEDSKQNNKRESFLESLKVDERGTTILFKKQKTEDKNIYSIAMKFLQEKNLNLNDGVKVSIEDKNHATIHYIDKNGNKIIEKLSISGLEKEAGR